MSLDSPLRRLHILILDDVGTPSLTLKSSFSDFISFDSDLVSLFIITSAGGLTPNDKLKCVEAIEIPQPTSNGLLEVTALKLHDKYRIDVIYTRQEDLILRAAYLREAMGLSSFGPASSLCFRDKCIMKETVHNGLLMRKTETSKLNHQVVNVPEFRRILSPCDVITFTQKFGYPVGKKKYK